MTLVDVFRSLKQSFNVRFVAVGAQERDMWGTPVEVWPWSEATETQSIGKLDIGIMPLPDSPWERGKCGYKLIQYMACGLPVVASPVGVNREIIDDGVHGFLADKSSDWESALGELLANNDKRRTMGQKGRKRVEKNYSVQAQIPRLRSLLRQAAASRCP